MSILIRVPTSHHREASQHVKCELVQQGYQSSTLLDCCVSNTLICKSDPSEAKPLEYQKKNRLAILSLLLNLNDSLQLKFDNRTPQQVLRFF